MLRGMTAAALLAWEHYDALEPFGESRDDIRFGHLALIAAQAARSAESLVAMKAGKHYKAPPALKLKDFVLEFGEPDEAPPERKKPDWRFQKQVALAIAEAFASKAK
jgi:hypothetical protein